MIEDYCTEPCTLQARELADEYGDKPGWQTPVPDLCRFERKHILVGTAKGDKTQGDGVVYLPNTRSWEIEDRFNYDGEAFKILQRRVERGLDGDGSYQRLFVQRLDVVS